MGLVNADITDSQKAVMKKTCGNLEYTQAPDCWDKQIAKIVESNNNDAVGDLVRSKICKDTKCVNAQVTAYHAINDLIASTSKPYIVVSTVINTCSNYDKLDYIKQLACYHRGLR